MHIRLGDSDYEGDDYYLIELRGLVYGLSEFVIAEASNENDLSEIHFPVGHSSRGTMVIEENEAGIIVINNIHYDVDGDGKTDFELSNKEGVAAAEMLEITERLLDTAELTESERSDIMARIATAKQILADEDYVVAAAAIDEVFAKVDLSVERAHTSTYEALKRLIGRILSVPRASRQAGNQPIDPEGKQASNGASKKAGKYNILVKVIDIFGNDTTKLVEVKI